MRARCGSATTHDARKGTTGAGRMGSAARRKSPSCALLSRLFATEQGLARRWAPIRSDRHTQYREEGGGVPDGKERSVGRSVPRNALSPRRTHHPRLPQLDARTPLRPLRYMPSAQARCPAGTPPARVSGRGPSMTTTPRHPPKGGAAATQPHCIEARLRQ